MNTDMQVKVLLGLAGQEIDLLAVPQDEYNLNVLDGKGGDEYSSQLAMTGTLVEDLHNPGWWSLQAGVALFRFQRKDLEGYVKVSAGRRPKITVGY